jgi:hypothetical protein
MINMQAIARIIPVQKNMQDTGVTGILPNLCRLFPSHKPGLTQ